MPKIIVQRKVNVWVADTYEVEDFSKESIQDAINYDLDADESDTLWETLIDSGPVEVFDDKFNRIYTNKEEYPHECFNK